MIGRREFIAGLVSAAARAQEADRVPVSSLVIEADDECYGISVPRG